MNTPNPQTLQPGRAYIMNGRPYTVGLLNFSRARMDPLFRKRKEIISRLHDIRRTIYARPPSVSISPSAQLVPVQVEARHRAPHQQPDPKQPTFRF